ncbi:MAG: hypothetical protein H5T62_08915 [Anaerolineae bacterium]|nr:hypothetical protein [Anaerolineae bacterium]
MTGRMSRGSFASPTAILGITSALPTWIQALDGNTSDSRAFPEIVAVYLAQMGEGEMPYLVADSALYSEEKYLLKM